MRLIITYYFGNITFVNTVTGNGIGKIRDNNGSWYRDIKRGLTRKDIDNWVKKYWL